MKEVKIPDLGSAVMSATISMWHYSVGDLVRHDDDLVEIVTDKSTFNISSPATGKVSKILFEEGDKVNPGDVIATIG